jgi:hypothetical protein
MVNFRFHLVSLTAVFLALAAGIVIGAGVVDRQTVGLLEGRVDQVERNRDRTNRENDELRADNRAWARFGEQAGDRVVEGKLIGVQVLLVGVDGTPQEAVASVAQTFRAAGAVVDGTMWFRGKWRLEEEAQARELAAVLSAQPTLRPVELRDAALGRLGGEWGSGGGGGALMTGLRDAAFVDFEPDPTAASAMTIEAVPRPGTVVVVVEAEDADVPPAELGLPLTVQLVERGLPVLAAQPLPAARKPGERDRPTPYVAAVRAEEDLAGRLSTVDNVDDYRGRVAAVFAVADLKRGRFGHYGVTDGAQRLVPEPVS